MHFQSRVDDTHAKKLALIKEFYIKDFLEKKLLDEDKKIDNRFVFEKAIDHLYDSLFNDEIRQFELNKQKDLIYTELVNMLGRALSDIFDLSKSIKDELVSQTHISKNSYYHSRVAATHIQYLTTLLFVKGRDGNHIRPTTKEEVLAVLNSNRMISNGVGEIILEEIEKENFIIPEEE